MRPIKFDKISNSIVSVKYWQTPKKNKTVRYDKTSSPTTIVRYWQVSKIKWVPRFKWDLRERENTYNAGAL